MPFFVRGVTSLFGPYNTDLELEAFSKGRLWSNPTGHGKPRPPAWAPCLFPVDAMQQLHEFLIMRWAHPQSLSLPSPSGTQSVQGQSPNTQHKSS
eukprot:1161525-Pelagomonas_calceolata.AAC.19